MLRGIVVLMLLFQLPASATPEPDTTPHPAVKVLIDKLNVAELTVEMADSAYKMRKTPATLADLVQALEKAITGSCFEGMHRSLQFPGNPQDPLCQARMNRLLEVHPVNAVGLCLRDGIDEPSCREAYQQQKITVYESTKDRGEQLLDPALKTGLSRKELNALDTWRRQLAELTDKFPDATTPAAKDELKKKALEIYEKAVPVACRVTLNRLIEKVDHEKKEDPLERQIEETRQKLLKIPENLRKDYQRRMVDQFEAQLARSKGSPEDKQFIIRLIEVAQNPEKGAGVASATMERVRHILPACNDYLGTLLELDPTNPKGVCYRDGLYSPNCILALRKAKRSASKLPPPPQGSPASKGPRDPIVSSF